MHVLLSKIYETKSAPHRRRNGCLQKLLVRFGLLSDFPESGHSKSLAYIPRLRFDEFCPHSDSRMENSSENKSDVAPAWSQLKAIPDSNEARLIFP